MNRRHCATAAMTLLCCALTVLAAPGTAFAAPAPAAGVSLPAAAVSLPARPSAPVLPAVPLPPDAPREKSLEQVRLEIEGLYHQAVSATDAYNLAEERAKRKSAEIAALAQRIEKGRERIATLRDLAGATARAQYQGGGLPAGARLVLTDDPRLFLDGVERVRQSMKATGDLMAELTRAQAELETYTEDAGAHWKDLEAERAAQASARTRITSRIAAAERLEGRLAEAELARLLILEKRAAEKAQNDWLKSGAPGGPGGGASARGAEAVAFAKAQIGKAYEWGAEGPRTYDCSGLTSKAWAAAGESIPRTSQEQWRRLPRVAVKDMRPGDLIIYHADASHVGMYVGDGMMVHSPRPGRQVTLAGAGSMRILGVVRPER
ncbi:NlpC/P60 family protein [Streptomyces sp. CAU 1734]|uniref:C40 family peptidase n=1 Tax=Streptomyces sp. CAU 1734 TaxID=3140360 RepID=UPI0032606005